jgi:hypothetical protein
MLDIHNRNFYSNSSQYSILLTLQAHCVMLAIMTHQKYALKRSIEIVKAIIIAQHKLFDAVFSENTPEIQAILHQMIHGKPHHKSFKLYYLLKCFLFSGGGDQSNLAYYVKQKYQPTFNRIRRAVKLAQCPKLATFEAFEGCRYQKTASTCNEPAFLGGCPLPAFDMKRGNLNHMAFSLYFFLRDMAGRDFYAYVSQHFGTSQLVAGTINEVLQTFIRKITAIANVGPKLAHMALSGLFLTRYLGWDYHRVGLYMIAVDSLVHNFLHRTGILDKYQLDHAYGPRCHTENGCSGVVQDLASRIDCREFNPSLPAHFPRFIQYQLWAYCAKDGENICNGNKCKPGKSNPACVLHQQQLCAQLPPQRPAQQHGDQYFFS